MKKTIIFLILFVSFVTAQAQISIGLKTGLNIFGTSNRDIIEQFFVVKPTLTANYSFFINYKLSEKFIIETGLTYARVGFNIKNDNINIPNFIPISIVGVGKQGLEYIDIPISVQYKIHKKYPFNVIIGVCHSKLYNVNAPMSLRIGGAFPLSFDFKELISDKTQIYGLTGFRGNYNINNKHSIFIEGLYFHGFSKNFESTIISGDFKGRKGNLNLGYTYSFNKK